MTTDKEIIDNKTIQLLELLDKYQQLTTLNRENFINGFFNLSRANFQNEKEKYGLEKYDFRCYKACKIIDINSDNGRFELIDRLLKNESSINDDEHDSSNEDKKKESSSTTMIRNRKDRKTGTITTHDKEIVKQSNDDEETFKDPIKQFGTIVPSELYKCQQNFNNGLNQLIEIINLQIQIKKLIQELS